MPLFYSIFRYPLIPGKNTYVVLWYKFYLCFKIVVNLFRLTSDSMNYMSCVEFCAFYLIFLKTHTFYFFYGHTHMQTRDHMHTYRHTCAHPESPGNHCGNRCLAERLDAGTTPCVTRGNRTDGGVDSLDAVR